MLSAGRRPRILEPSAPSAASRNNTVAPDPTFRRLLGEAAWQRLNPNVRARFAVKPDAGQVFTFTGVMDVVRRSWFGWLVGQVCRFIGTPVTPRQGRDVPTVVHIYRSSRGDGIVWERRYGFSGRSPVVVSSTKRADPPDGLLECASRGFAMRLRLFERDGAIHFASTGYCLEVGRVIAEGDPVTVRNDSKVIASYLGVDERAIQRSGTAAAAPVQTATTAPE